MVKPIKILIVGEAHLTLKIKNFYFLFCNGQDNVPGMLAAMLSYYWARKDVT